MRLPLFESGFCEHAKGLRVDCIRRREEQGPKYSESGIKGCGYRPSIVLWAGTDGIRNTTPMKTEGNYSQITPSPTAPEIFQSSISSAILRQMVVAVSAAR